MLSDRTSLAGDHRVWLASLGLYGLLSLACTSAEPEQTTQRLAAIELRVKREQARLEDLQRNVAEMEKRAERARVDAEFQSCRATAKEIRAEGERRRAACAKDLADRNLCKAHNSERAATGGLFGCLAGIAAAAFTGGAATPWALGGCGAGLGAGAMASDECPAASCVSQIASIGAAILAERGLQQIPRCGGYLGIEVAPSIAVVSGGLTINRVRSGTCADSAGVAGGDILIEVNGMATSTVPDIDAALQTTREGAILPISVIRSGELFRLYAPASRRFGDGAIAQRLKLGVDIGDAVSNVRYKEGVVVRNVDVGSPASAAGLRENDEIKSLSATSSSGTPLPPRIVYRTADVETFFEDTGPYAEVTITTAQLNKESARKVTLIPRAQRVQL